MISRVCPKCGYEITGLPHWQAGASVKCPNCDPEPKQAKPKRHTQAAPRVLGPDLEPLPPANDPPSIPSTSPPPRVSITPHRGPRMGSDIARQREREARRQEAARRQAEQQAARIAQQEAERARLAAIDTGGGQCPRCGGSNITTVRRSEGSSIGQSLSCCVGCFLFWPALLLMPFMKTQHTCRHCVLCGYEWPT